MPLKIRRRVGEKFTVTDREGAITTVIVTRVRGNGVELVIDAPLSHRIMRPDAIDKKPKAPPS